MPKIQVEKPFTLTHSNGMQQQFRAGAHDVPQEVAEHWYVQAHLAKPESDAEAPEGGGDAAGADAARAPRARRKPQATEGGDTGGDDQ